MSRVTKEVYTEFPDKMDGEEPATAKQLAYIRDLVEGNVELPPDLGKWQASSLIKQIKKEKEDYQAEVDSANSGGCLSVILLGSVLTSSLFYFIIS
ncbi:DUF3072 domain-containing protein [Akkermansiaceae bacterium]|nr:DUF3072 domain-containing protein [Akkermansiaceae bacterium]